MKPSCNGWLENPYKNPGYALEGMAVAFRKTHPQIVT
jgi:hypothetical protein